MQAGSATKSATRCKPSSIWMSVDGLPASRCVTPVAGCRSACCARQNRRHRRSKREQGRGNRELGTGNREQGTRNREQGRGNREQGTACGRVSAPPHLG